MFDLVLTFSYEIFLTFLLIYTLLISYFTQHSWNKNSYSSRAYSSELAVFFSAFLLLMLILFYNGEYHYHFRESWNQPFYANNDFQTTPFLFFSKIFAIVITSSCLLFSSYALRYNQFTRIEYPFFFLSALLAILFLISSSNLVYIYLSLELLNFSLYLIVGSKVFSSLANEASQRYFVYSSYASALFLLGIALLYGLYGTVNLQELGTLTTASLVSLPQKSLFSLALFFLYGGLLFKLSIFPFHFWVSEVYEGSPLSSILFLATAPKIAFVTLFLKITLILACKIPFFLPLLQVLSLLSIAYGTIAGLYEYRLKRWLAYSTISNMGFVIFSLSLASVLGLTAGLLYFIVYLLSITAFFGLLMLFQPQSNLGKWDPHLESLELREIFSLQHYSKQPAYVFTLSLLILSLAGIPPLAGFFTKFYILQACLLSGNVLLAFLLFLLSVLALGFYLRLLRILYVEPLALSFQKKNLRNIFFFIELATPPIFFLIVSILFFILAYALLFNNLLLFLLTALVLTSFSL